jgi:hypothetical protein
MRQLFLKSVRFSATGSGSNEWEQEWKSPQGTDREFIVVSHSLGSYMVFSALNMGQHLSPPNASAGAQSGAAAEDAAAQYILERTSLVYFFANQVSLLELTNLRVPNAAALGPAAVASPEGLPGALNGLITNWKNLRERFEKRGSGAEQPGLKPPQVIAWSDPSDLLSWRLPAIDGLVITNLYVRNTAWHWIIANPSGAHGNYATNKEVLRIMFGPQPRTHNAGEVRSSAGPGTANPAASAVATH